MFCGGTYCTLAMASLADATLHHDMRVSIHADDWSLEVEDRIGVPAVGQQRALSFSLHKNMQLLSTMPAARKTHRQGHLQHYELLLPAEADTIKMHYRGRIDHAVRDVSDSPGKTQPDSLGQMNAEGYYLDAGSAWYADFAQAYVRFRLSGTTIPGWQLISQGEKHSGGSPAAQIWQEDQPQLSIYLIAGPFQAYASDDGRAQVYLRAEDNELAQKYLSATARYVAMYEELLGPYPYAKFALIENNWESGYGMPSFTLLGSRVIRLPFIVHTSYPHEILHNWWGNGVYVDLSEGNWSEGLTTYLADHWLRAQRGKGAAYRFDALRKFSEFVSANNDFPLRDFYGRHSESSQAIGYAKAMMVFHMLRQQLGDAQFFAGLRAFYQQHRFQRAAYSDLQAVMEEVSGASLTTFFQQWLTRTDGPQLALSSLRVREHAGEVRLSGELVQTQADEAWQLQVPVAITTASGVTRRIVPMTDKRQPFSWTLAEAPVRIQVDPDTDVFRRLSDTEMPLTLARFFASGQNTLVVPDAAPAPLKQAYQALAEDWSLKTGGHWAVVSDSAVERLDAISGNVLVLSRHNRLASDFARASGQPISDGFVLDGYDYAPTRDSVVLSTEGAQDETHWVYIDAPDPAAIAGLARKVPHYTAYSYLVFTGEGPQIQVKGQWQSLNTPMVACFAAMAVQVCE